MTTTSLYVSGMLRDGKNIKEWLFESTQWWSNLAPFEANDTSDLGLNRSGWVHAECLVEASPHAVNQSPHKKT